MLKLSSKKAQIPALELILLFFIGVVFYSICYFYFNEKSKQERLLITQIQTKAIADFISSAIVVNMINRECVNASYATLIIRIPTRVGKVPYLLKLENDTVKVRSPLLKENATLFNLYHLNKNLEGYCESVDMSCFIRTDANQTKIFS